MLVCRHKKPDPRADRVSGLFGNRSGLFRQLLGLGHEQFGQVRSEVFTLVFTQDPQRQADQSPQMHAVVTAFEMFAQIMDLSMAIMTRGNGVRCSCGHNLVIFYLAEGPALIRPSILQKSTAAAAAVVVGAVGRHVDEIFLSDNRLGHVSQILCHRISQALAHQLAGILYRKLDPQILIPIRVDLESTLSDPFGIEFDDSDDFEIVLDPEFCQSGPDCE